MKRLHIVIIILLLGLYTNNIVGQKITYGEPDRKDARDFTFEVIGKTGSNVLIFKFQRTTGEICAYNDEMQLVNRARCNYFPGDKVFNAEFVNYNNHSIIVYQYQKRNTVYCDAAMVDSLGEIIGKPLNIDTAKISFIASNKIFHFIKSDNKQHLAVVKTYRKNKITKFSIVRFNQQLEISNKIYADFKWPEDEFELSEFSINNNGSFAFLYNEFGQWNSEAVNSQALFSNDSNSLNFDMRPIALNKNYVFDTRIKADNVNNKWILTSLYSSSKRGNIEGFQVSYVPNNKDSIYIFTHKISDQIRKEAKGESSTRTALNDYIQRSVIVKKDGGIIITAESYYVTGRDIGINNNFNNWNSFNRYSWQQDYFAFDPYYNYYYQPFRQSGFANNKRYHSDNIIVTSYNDKGENLWTQVINKLQFEDDNENFISFLSSLISGQILYLFNKYEQGDWLLYAHGISPDGTYTRYPTLRNLNRDYEFLIRLGKQISNKTLIVPFKYRNYICFAKIEF